MCDDRDRADNKTEVPLIEVTPEMIDAGISELYDHGYVDDLRLVIEQVYRAMCYASVSASATSLSK